MACVKRLFNLSVFFAIALVAHTWFITTAQTPDTRLKDTASITGRVTIGEKPAPGVTVAATALNSQTLVAQTVTDGEGKYRISGLTSGQINISAVAPTFVMPASPSSFMQGRILNLAADEIVDAIDFKLTRGGVITGRITDGEGKPVMEERVTLTLIDEKGEPLRTPMARGPNPFIYSTDDRGIYRVYGLAAGRYKVSVGDNGGGATLRPSYYQRTYYPDTTDVAKAAIVALGEGGEAKNIDISLGVRSRTYTVTGRIIDADNGQPMAGVSYAFGALQQNQSRTIMAGMSSPGTPTNSKGEFRLEGIAPGRYAVTASTNSFFQSSNQPKVFSDPVPFEIIDSDVTDIEVKAQHGLTVSGIVVADGITNKNALAGVSRLMVSGYVEPSATGVQTFSTGTSSQVTADGIFQLEGLRPGKVTLSIAGFSDSNYGKGYTVSRVVADRELPNRQIELAPGQNVSGVRIYIAYGTGVVKGEIKFEGGTLPADVLLFVMVRREGSQVSSAQVDARGRFIVGGIPAGTYEAVLQIMSLGPTSVLANLPRTQRQTVSVSDDSESQITFTLDLTSKEKP